MSALFPIREISSYNRKWKIKARCTSKSDLRSYMRNGQQGNVFSADLLDHEGGEIRCSFFGDAANKFFDILEKGKVYTFANGSVKVANKKYNSLNHNYEIAFAEATAEIVQQDDDSSIEQMNWNIQSIRSLMNKEPPFNTDLCGTIHKYEPVSTIRTKKDNNEVSKRVISIADSSGSSIDVTLWADLANMDDKYFEGAPSVALKSVGIREWGQRSGSLSVKTNFVSDPSNVDVKKQSEWWKTSGGVAELTNLTQVQAGGLGAGKTPWVTLAEMKMQGQDQLFLSGSDAKYFNCFARLATLKVTDREGKQQMPFYEACPKCNRKLDANHTCIEHGTVDPSPRYMFTAAFADLSDHMWLTCFHETGQLIFGTSADKTKLDIESMAPEKYSNWMKNHQLEGLYKVVVKVKPDEYQGERRPKYSVVRTESMPADTVAEFMYQTFIQKATEVGDVPDFSRAVAMAQ